LSTPNVMLVYVGSRTENKREPKKQQQQPPQSPMDLWGPGERHGPLGHLVLIIQYQYFTNI